MSRKRSCRLFLSSLVLCLAVGCATVENYQKILDSWMYSTEENLVAAWGIPDSVYESGHRKYLSYVSSRSGYVPGTAPTYQTTFIGNTAYTSSSGGTPGFAFTRRCKTTFTVIKSVITHYTFEGNNCKARAPE